MSGRATDLQADLASHHIEGIAIHGNTPFRADLISHITGNLWTGGCINGVRLPDDFKAVVSLYPWEKYTLGPDTVRVEHRLYDSTEVPDVEQMFQVARQVRDFYAAGKTLVHCQAGLNRSGLIAGLALVYDGCDPQWVVNLLREKRSPAVLCNRAFERWLLAQRLA